MYSVLVCQLYWLCLMINPNWLHFPVLSIIQNKRRGRDENFIPLECLIYVSPLAFHVQGVWFTWVSSPLTFWMLDSRESICLSCLECLIHVSPLASHVREWMSVCFVKRLNVKSEHHSLRCKHLLYFESNWLIKEFPQHVRIKLLHLFYESYFPHCRTFVIYQVFYSSSEIIIKNGEIWWWIIIGPYLHIHLLENIAFNAARASFDVCDEHASCWNHMFRRNYRGRFFNKTERSVTIEAEYHRLDFRQRK